jgi:hypothetical protein
VALSFPTFPRAKIDRAVKSILPKGNFKLRIANAKLGDLKIVRVVTPAWKSLRSEERNLKVLKAVAGGLSEREEDRILRYSVLTPEEYNTLVLNRSNVRGSSARGRRDLKNFRSKRRTNRRAK